MSLEQKVRSCLNSQEIREKITKDKPTLLVPSFNEERIQPSSFEPVISEELFILDTETEGMFRPQPKESIYQTLLQLPGRQRRRENIRNGFEIKKSFTYLIPLEERIILSKGEYIKSSPKSSFGRLFLNTRMLTDYNPCFDEINAQYKTSSELNMWLLVQPLAFNMIIYSGLPLNQMRFFIGQNFQLTPIELIKEFKKNPLLYIKRKKSLIPANPIITEGLQIHLDLSGENTGGIGGLRARHNPTPIDLRKKYEYEAEDFFDPLKCDKKITIKRSEYYLLCSKEVLKIPSHLNVELKSHSHIGLTGPLHFAGFIDNGFEGDLVFEVRSDELSSMELVDWMPISKLDVFGTNPPDKTYGHSIGSNYYEQTGPRPSKFFKEFDFNIAARNYKKLDRMVLVQEANILNSFRKKESGFEFLEPSKVPALYKIIEKGFFQSRYDCEDDELILQLVPYVVLFRDNNTVFSYVRAKDIEKYGDKRLFEKYSVGVGGHINKTDGPEYIKNCIEREVIREEVNIKGSFSEPRLVGTLMAYDKPVDRVHFGLVFIINVQGEIVPKEDSFSSGGMMPIDELVKDKKGFKKYETWSKCLIPHLPELYKIH
nr:2'-deoxycytidine 5'-triphosphate deaminase [Nanoarchaeota archaeon]